MAEPLSADIIDDVRRRIVHQLQESDQELRPVFYAVTGSHLHNVAGPDSDIDVQGFHCADGTRYMLFDEPASRVEFIADIVLADSELDVVSYELRAFGEQLAKSDFTTVELLYADQPVLNEKPDSVESVRSIVERSLPGELPTRYMGMARSLYTQYLGPDAPDSNAATLNHYLYALRGSLAARFVLQKETIEPNLHQLGTALLNDEGQETLQRIVEYKRAGRALDDDTTLKQQAQNLIRQEIDAFQGSNFPDIARAEYRERLAAWMLDVRDISK